jgi:hypothetical protein
MIGITKNMINEFNTQLENKGSIIRLYPRGRTVDIKLSPDDYLKMEGQIINPTRAFYNDLQEFFSNRGIQLTFNNTWSCFWATNLVNVIE